MLPSIGGRELGSTFRRSVNRCNSSLGTFLRAVVPTDAFKLPASLRALFLASKAEIRNELLHAHAFLTVVFTHLLTDHHCFLAVVSPNDVADPLAAGDAIHLP